MGQYRCRKIRSPRERIIRRALGLVMIFMAFGLILSLLICRPAVQCLLIIVLLCGGCYMLV